MRRTLRDTSLLPPARFYKAEDEEREQQLAAMAVSAYTTTTSLLQGSNADISNMLINAYNSLGTKAFSTYLAGPQT